MNNSYDISDLVWLIQNFEVKLWLPTCKRMDAPIVHHVTCHVIPSAHPLFDEQKGTTPQRQARLTGGTGLYMNYSIIFTEISFDPETSILLQIIHVTFRIMPEFDR